MGFLSDASRLTRLYRCGSVDVVHRGFLESLWRGWRERGLAVIGEFKRCAPGRFVALHEPWAYAEMLAPHVDAFSVLTEPFWFCGSPELIPVFARLRPVLAKDFVECIDQLRVYAEKGASAVLLILGELGWRRLDELYSEARSLGLDALIETSSAREAIEVASSYPEAAVGINARNLETLELSIDRLASEVAEAARELGERVMLVAESGVSSVEDAVRLAEAGAKAVLIGTWFMREPGAAERLAETLKARKERLPQTS